MPGHVLRHTPLSDPFKCLPTKGTGFLMDKWFDFFDRHPALFFSGIIVINFLLLATGVWIVAEIVKAVFK